MRALVGLLFLGLVGCSAADGDPAAADGSYTPDGAMRYFGWFDGVDELGGTVECTGEIAVSVTEDDLSDGEFFCENADDGLFIEGSWTMRRLPASEDRVQFSDGGEGRLTCGHNGGLVSGVIFHDVDVGGLLGAVPFVFDFSASR